MLSMEEKQWLLALARKTIGFKLGLCPQPDAEPVSEQVKEDCGAFVTLHENGSLRGCIGYVQALKPLYLSVIEMAEAAAFKDPRFPPLSPDEYGGIDLEISVMSPLKRIRSVDEVEVGKHGLVMKRGLYQGLLLPQVATEQSWDRDAFLEHTCYKAGLPGDAWRDPDTEIYIFSAEVFSEDQKGPLHE